MTYILMIWTVVACRPPYPCSMDWRPIGEFHSSQTMADGLSRCEEAGRQLGIKAENFRCVRSK